MKAVFLPLDSRPCTYDFPVKIAAGTALSVLRPPAQIMDSYRTPSRYQEIAQWLWDACDGADALVCSMDQLVYGGLLASRSMLVEETEALERAKWIKKIRERYPGLEIYLSSVIMRTTVSTLSDQDQIWWEKVARYSALDGRTETEAVQERERLQREIPEDVLGTFLRARKRNHSVNRFAVELACEKTVNMVCLLQEDSTPFGMHKKEQEALTMLAGEQGAADRVFLHCGTDEFACAMAGYLAARAAGRCEEKHNPVRLCVEWLSGNPDFVAKYEDRPFAETLSSYLRLLGVRRVDSPDEADAILAVYAPSAAGQEDLAFLGADATAAPSREEAERAGERLKRLLGYGIPTGLADVYYANGGESRLLTAGARDGWLLRLSAYAGWNTASNTLGTVLGQLIAVAAGKSAASDTFLKERLLDDWVYQGIVRRKFNSTLKKAGEDIWNISRTDAAQQCLQEYMEAARETAMISPGRFCSFLRWPRSFEAEFEIVEEN